MGIMRNEDFSRPPRRNKSWLKKKELDFIKKMSGEVVTIYKRGVTDEQALFDLQERKTVE